MTTLVRPPARPLLAALTGRDFPALGDCLAPDVRFRATLPPRMLDLTGRDATLEHFRTWFGGDDALEVLDTAVGGIGPKVYLRWRLRLTAPDGAAREVEQHVFATGGERFEALDLLCSGFVPG